MSNDLEKLVRSYMGEVQALNDAAVALLAAVGLDDAVGVQLDGLGVTIGIERLGLSDELYRSLLRAYVRVNASGGTIEQLNEIVRLASNTTAADRAFTLTEGAPAEFLIEFPGILAAGIGAIVADAVYGGKAAGVHGVTKYHELEPVFAFDGGNGTSFDYNGYLRSAIRNRGARESEIL